MSKKLVLVVEDDPYSAEFFKKAIDRTCDAIIAPNGAAALSIITDRAEEIDIAVLDILLPDIQGDEIAEHLVLLGIQFIIYSASNDKTVIEKATQGAFAYLPKDADHKTIRKTVAAGISKNNRDPSRVAIFLRLKLRESTAVAIIAKTKNISLLRAQDELRLIARRHKSTREVVIKDIIEGHELLAG